MPSDNARASHLDRCQRDEPPPCIVLRQRTTGGKLRRWLVVALAASVWLYLAAVLVVWLLLRLGGDCWWPATVLLFGPRWLYAVPWPALVLGAALARRRLLWPLAAVALVLIGPIAGLCFPWARLVGPDGPELRVLTFNINGHAVDTRRLMALVADAKPDVVALQECPPDTLTNWPPGWHVRRAGRLLVASRYPLGEVDQSRRRHPPSRWPSANALRCTVETPFGPVGFCCIHLRTPRQGLGETLDSRTVVSPARSVALTAGTAHRRLESAALVEWLVGLSDRSIVVGDFNMPTQSAIYRASWARYANAFSRSGFGFGYTKWTPIGKCRYGLRIDHILTPPGMKSRRCWIGPDIGSDHLPLLADLVPVEAAAVAK